MDLQKAYLSAVESIYEAATDPALWPAALEMVTATSGGAAFLCFRDPALSPTDWPITFAGMEQNWIDAYHRHYAGVVAWSKNPVPRRSLGTAVPSEQVIAPTWSRPSGIPTSCARKGC